MSIKDVIGILQVGFSGFAFLVAGYSFYLLRGESRRDGTPRKPLLDAIRRYANFTLIMAVIVALSKAGDSALTAWNKRQADESVRLSREAQTCRDALIKLTLGDARIAKDYDTLLQAVQASAPSCTTVLKSLEE